MISSLEYRLRVEVSARKRNRQCGPGFLYENTTGTRTQGRLLTFFLRFSCGRTNNGSSEILFDLGPPQWFSAERMIKTPSRQRHHAEQSQNRRRYVPGRKVRSDGQIHESVHREGSAGQRYQPEAEDNQDGDEVNNDP